MHIGIYIGIDNAKPDRFPIGKRDQIFSNSFSSKPIQARCILVGGFIRIVAVLRGTGLSLNANFF